MRRRIRFSVPSAGKGTGHSARLPCRDHKPGDHSALLASRRSQYRHPHRHGSGFWILDVDGEDGEASLRALEAKHGALPPTRESLTARGRHIWFRYDRPIPSAPAGSHRDRYPRRWRLRRRTAVHSPERPRLCLVGRSRRRSGHRARLAGASRAQETGVHDIGARDCTMQAAARRCMSQTLTAGRARPRMRRSPPQLRARAIMRSTARRSRCSSSSPAANSIVSKCSSGLVDACHRNGSIDGRRIAFGHGDDPQRLPRRAAVSARATGAA